MPAELDRTADLLLKYRTLEISVSEDFADALNAACGETTARALAKRLQISEQYLSDIRRRNRRVPDRVLRIITAGGRADA